MSEKNSMEIQIKNNSWPHFTNQLDKNRKQNQA